MERHGYDDGWDSNYKEQETRRFFRRFFLLKMLKWIIIRSKKKVERVSKKNGGNFFTVIM